MKRLYNKSSLLLVFLTLFISSGAYSQASLHTPYAFSTGGATAFPAGTTISFGAGVDDNAIVIAPGFSFQCGGAVYNNFLVSTNGWVALLPSAVIPPYFTGSLPANSLSGYAGGTPIIAPMWDDIASTQFVYSIVGTDMFIRWNSRMPKNSTAAGYSFGVRLSAAGAITFIYPTSVYNMNGATPSSASIGYASGCGEYYSITPTGTATATISDAAEFSTALAPIVTTITGTAGNPTVNVGSSAGIVTGLFIGGTGIGPGATVAGVAGTVVTSSVNNLGALSGSGNFYMRPNNVQYVLNPTMNANDLCANATSLGTITAACTYITASNAHNTKTAVTGPSCAASDTGDVWFSFIKPLGVTAVTVTTAPLACPLAMTGTTVELFTTCAGAAVACATTSIANPTYGELSVSRPCAAETLLVRVTGDNNRYGKFQICARIGTVTNLGFTCSTAQSICALPFTSPGNTLGTGNEYDSTTAVCHNKSMNGEDYVYAYTPTGNECITITGTTADPSIGISVYNGCPDSTGGAATYCMAIAESITGTATISSLTLTAGVTYYIVIDSQTGSIAYNLNISSSVGAPPNDLCGSATNLGTIASGVTCTYSTYTTSCATPSPVLPGPAGVPAPSCVPNQVPRAFIDGITGDVWLRFAAGYTGTLQISTVQSAVNPTANAAMAVYTGASCATLALAACDYNSGVNGMPLLSIPVSNGVTYYIRIWSENPENAGQFDICFSSNCAPPNDLPCAAVLVPLGSTTTGYNTCAGIVGEPLNAAQCVAGGTINTVWYKAVVPASGQVHVRTHPLTLTDTQIQGFTFASGCANAASTFTARGCNDDGPNCSGGFQDFSDFNFTGLTAGDTLFIAVDGTNSLTGSFEITFIDGTAPAFPPIPQQDCAGAQVVCSTSNITVADPGFRNYGNICDMPNSTNTCWGVGERNSVWYTFTTSGTGKVKFDILTPSSTDIDFILWDVTGVSNPCGLIQSASLANVGCNYAASLPATGLMDPPLAAGYSNSVNVTGTRTFILLLNVFNSATNAGFTLNWQGTPIAAAGTTAIWSGGVAAADTLFGCGTCWGDCGAAPTCGVDATVNPVANLRQPTVTVNSSVRDLTINAGATLRIKAGITLSVCGNFTNNGTLICEPGSTVQFQLGSPVQTISGNLTGANAFANLVVNKSAGAVVLGANIDVREDFTTATNTSQFNINGRYMKVGGDFTNANGTATFLIANLGNSRVEFNGTANQNFTNTAGTFNLNRMIMNKPTGILYLMGANSSINIDTTLTLTSGVVNTRNVATNFIFLKWINANAVTGYNATSYVDGKLRRQIYNFGYDARGMLLDWPVGDAVKGYQLANILFSPAGPTPGVSYLTGSFDSWPAAPPASGPVASECLFATYDILPISDNGYWTFTRATTANYNGNYTMSLNNNNFTASGAGWTVAVSDLINSPSNPASWRLAGNCVTTSTQSLTRRSGINAVPAAADFFDLYYTTAISFDPLPIELLYFDATKTDKFVVCKWETATEINNDYFNVERSDDGITFEKIGEVKGFGAGTTTTNRTYSFTDDDVCNTIRYYRLKQVDIDTKSTYSDIVAVNCKASGDGIKVYPNPAVQNITCEFYQDKEDNLEISILDVTGRVVKSETYNAQKGMNAPTIQIEELSKGAYYLQIRGVNDLDNVAKRQQQFFKN